jgi:hypothetical protein
MSDLGGGRRAWRARAGAKPTHLDLVWDFVGWFSLFPGVAMLFAAFGGGRYGAQPMGVVETWIWMVAAAATMFVLVLALAVRRAKGVTPRRYPAAMFGLIIFVAVAAPTLAWVRLEGIISPLGWAAIGACVGTVALSAIMLIPPPPPP